MERELYYYSRPLFEKSETIKEMVIAETKSYITHLTQKFYFNSSLQEEVAHIHIHIKIYEVLIRLRKIAAMNSLNLSFLGQELKSSYSNKSFLLLNNMFRKNRNN